MKKLALYILGWLCLGAANAQFSIAVMGGGQSTTVTPAFLLHPDTTSKTTASRAGFRFGLLASAPINRQQSLYFQTGVFYSQKGAKAVQLFDTSNAIPHQQHFLSATTTLSVNYIDIPLNLLFKIALKGKTKFLMGAGLQASLFYNGSAQLNTVKFIEDPFLDEIDYEFAEEKHADLPVGKGEQQYRVMHFGANALAGFEFGRVFFNAHYSRDLNGFYGSNDQSYKFQSIGASIGIYLGNTRKPQPTITDADGDGVPDVLDACPLEAGPTLTNGCPDRDGDGVADKDDACPDQAGTLANKGCPVLDRDGDGVADAEDKCPDVPGSKKYNGCPIPDTDGDGVNDEEDQCPTVAGTKENHGCPLITEQQTQTIKHAATQITFDFNSASLSPASYEMLDQVVQILKENPVLKIRVEGHTSGADNERNMVLSEQRAQSVKSYLVKKGIAETRITAVGYGSKKPLNKSTKPEEYAKNRRVELITE